MTSVFSLDLQKKLDQLGILAPVDLEANTKWLPAPRLLNLHSKSGGFLGKRKANADLLLSDLRERLEKRFELRDSVVLNKFVYSRPAGEDLVDALAQRCDFIVTAIAD